MHKKYVYKLNSNKHQIQTKFDVHVKNIKNIQSNYSIFKIYNHANLLVEV